MGQFDSSTDGALARLESERLLETPGLEFAGLVQDLLGLVLGDAAGIVGLIDKIRHLAGASYASNLIYAITAVRDDLKRLYETCEDLRSRIEALPSNPDFVNAISMLALRAMHTSAQDRLKRLARIVTNGVRVEDLAPEWLDDSLRAATELSGDDIRILSTVSVQMQKARLVYSMSTTDGTINHPREVWQALEQRKIITLSNHLSIRGSLARIQSLGFGVEIQTMESSWLPRFVVTPEGERFLRSLQEIAE